MFISVQETASTEEIRTGNKNTFQLIGDISTFSITFERPDGSGGWLVHKKEGSDVVLDADNTSVTVDGPLRLRVNKPATTSYACGVEVG